MKSRTTQLRSPVPLALRAIDVRVLTSLFDLTLDVAFFVTDAEGRYLAVNESLIARHGLKQASDAIGKRPRDICPGDTTWRQSSQLHLMAKGPSEFSTD